jgi:hypothetical protein
VKQKRPDLKTFMDFMVETINHDERVSMNSIQPRVRKKKLSLRFSDIRENHGTFLTRFLNPAEIDFLSGRCSTSVSMKNYFNPSLIGDLK